VSLGLVPTGRLRDETLSVRGGCRCSTPGRQICGVSRAATHPSSPHAEQAELVRRVESLLGQGESISERLEAASIQVDRSTQAVLAKAFRGELVMTPTEPANDGGLGEKEKSESGDTPPA